ncbi:MAG: S8 family serine peptidase, partial [Phycisphaerales bacterium]
MNEKMTARLGKTVRRSMGPTISLLLLLCAPSVLTGATGAIPAPDFEASDLGGRTVTLGALRGTNVVLLFGSTSCPHCDAALSVLEDLYGTVGDELQIFFVGVGQSARELSDAFGPEFPPYGILPDEDRTIGRSFLIRRIPTCVFIDKQGVVQYSGRLREELIWRLLSGERLVYPGRGKLDIAASERLRSPVSREARRKKRFIVELAEDPRGTGRITSEMRRSRRRQYAESAGQIGARIIHNYGKLKNRIVVEVNPNDVEKLRRLPRFRSFREDRRVRALLADSVYQIKADYAWDSAVTGDGVNVCVVDTGIDYTHPDLQNKVVAQYNAMDDSGDAMDDSGHGTHCAGIIASGGLVYRGVSYDASLMGAKVLGADGSGYASDVILGVNWCVAQGADVINLSLGEGLFSDTCDDDEMAKAVNAAVEAGVVVVCAAGNDGDSSAMVSPACASKVIAVGALDKNNGIADYSDGGPELDVVAPGGGDFGGNQYPEIVSTFSTEVANNPFYCLYQIGEECYDNYFVVEGTRYIRAVGTSMATPHVAGAAALLLEENPSLTPGQIKQVLQENADDLGAPGWDNVYGWGRINIEKSLDNLPAEAAELMVSITEPNGSEVLPVNTGFALAAAVDCLGGDGCGEVRIHAQLCEGRDCSDFVDINSATTISTLDENPNDLGVLSGYTLETEAPVVFDAETVLDISESDYDKSVNPERSLFGAEIPAQYSTGDLEPADNIGAIGENSEKLYAFEIPEGVVTRLRVRLEHWMVIHWVEPYAGWNVYTSNVDGDNLNQVGGDCIPAEGGGGEAIPPDWDCWFETTNPDVLKDLNPGGTSYIKLVSHDVYSDDLGNPDWLTFNDIEVIADYRVDPNRDNIYKYCVKFDLSGIDASDEVTAARMQINITEGVENAVAEVYLVDDELSGTDPAQVLHEPSDPCYSSLMNPVKSFSCADTGLKSLNVKAAVAEALAAGRDAVAFQIAERNNDHLVTLEASSGQSGPVLVISQKVDQIPGGQSGEPVNEPNNGPRPLVYDTVLVRSTSTDAYSRDDYPVTAAIGAGFTSEYNSGDLEPEDGIGAVDENAEKLYDFNLPAGVIKHLRITIVNYLVIHFTHPPYATWRVYTSDAQGTERHLVGECTPPEGGGGFPVPPDCLFDSNDPAVLADLAPGRKNYIKLVSYGVEENDWLTFSDFEVTAEYEAHPENDEISRYYVKFDISGLGAHVEVDSATLNLYVSEPGEEAVAQLNLADSVCDPCTGAYTIYHANEPAYSSLNNPIKSFACGAVGPIQLNVKAAVEDAVESAAGQIAFLVTERYETSKDAAFAIDAGAGANPPRLDVYTKTGTSRALVRWSLLPATDGDFKLRVMAENNVGIDAVSDAQIIRIYDANRPVIGKIDCLIDSAWKDCTLAGYGDRLEKIRIEASDPQGTPEVWLTLRNVPDDHNFVDAALVHEGGYFTHDTDLVISDSGHWQIQAVCTDSDGNTDSKTISWNVPWGSLAGYVISPTTSVTVAKSGSFTVRTGLQCLEAECPGVQAALQLNDPNELKYDDGTAQDYGDLGSTNSYLAVKFEPETYPAQLRTARFYVWDKTTYPFELHIWDDDGPVNAPKTELLTPFVVDPVTASGPNEVAWFD